jgi:Leucine-rich repeat (LRR) protein
LLDFEFPLVKFSRLRSNTFKKFENLIGLKLGVDTLQQVDEDAFAGLDHLIHLWIRGGQFKTLPLPSKVFDNTRMLKILDLASNQIEILNPRWFVHLTELKLIALNFNQIKAIPDSTWVNNKKLMCIEMIHNKIETISRTNMVTFGNFVHLYLDNNDCVDIHFYVTKGDRANNRSLANLIEAILFPNCDDSSEDQAIEPNDKAFILIVLIVIAVVASLLILARLLKFKLDAIKRNRVTQVDSTQSNRNSKLKMLWKDYVNSTSIHGIRYMGESSHWMERFVHRLIY